MNTPVPAAGLATVPSVDAPPAMSLRESLALLDSRLDGRLSIPGDAGWDADRAAWNLAIDQRPVAVAVVASVADVARVVETARDLGLAVVPQSTGHNACPLIDRNDLADAILLRTHDLRGVVVDPIASTARVEAGAQWGDVVAAVAPHGLAALAGSSHDVGVVGYTLGGGLSWLARAHGLAANQVLAVELVTADGVLRRVDADHDADLFWAVRGGGGDFGIVTALEFRLFDVPEVVAGTLFFPIERTEEVLRAWGAWTQTLPDSVTSVGRVLRFPPLPDLPPFLSGQSYVVVEAAMLESVERAADLLAPLRALGPVIDTVHPQPAAELLQLHMDPPGPTPGMGDGMMLSDLDEQALASALHAFAHAVGPDSGSALLSAEIRHLGGMVRPAAARARAEVLGLPEPGATAGFEGGYLVYGVGIPTPAPGAVEELVASLGRLLAQIELWRADVDYVNFAERTRDPERLFGVSLERLREIKRTVDPTGVIRSNHPVR